MKYIFHDLKLMDHFIGDFNNDITSQTKCQGNVKVYTINIRFNCLAIIEKQKGNFMPNFFRLIQTPPSSGAFNMALDEALLITTSQKSAMPALRLYSWDPPTLSLGYAQRVNEVDLNKLAQLGWDLVRRPTGGRAILHTDELTYSITAAVDNPVVQGSLLESYQRISAALLLALSFLGIVADANRVYGASQGIDKEPVCFEVPSNFEITVSGKKLIGSAQARKNSGVLQHGSLPLTGDLTRITQVLKYPDEQKRVAGMHRLLDHAGTILSLTGKNISCEDAQNAFIAAFAKQLDLDFRPTDPSDEEIALTNELMMAKYSSSEWNHRI
jgi:lipoyl(octanoyl) transferase